MKEVILNADLVRRLCDNGKACVGDEKYQLDDVVASHESLRTKLEVATKERNQLAAVIWERCSHAAHPPVDVQELSEMVKWEVSKRHEAEAENARLREALAAIASSDEPNSDFTQFEYFYVVSEPMAMVRVIARKALEEG